MPSSGSVLASSPTICGVRWGIFQQLLCCCTWTQLFFHWEWVECKYKVSKGMLEHFCCCIGQITIEDIKKPFLLTDQLQYALKKTWAKWISVFYTFFHKTECSVIHISWTATLPGKTLIAVLPVIWSWVQQYKKYLFKIYEHFVTNLSCNFIP